MLPLAGTNTVPVTHTHTPQQYTPTKETTLSHDWYTLYTFLHKPVPSYAYVAATLDIRSETCTTLVIGTREKLAVPKARRKVVWWVENVLYNAYRHAFAPRNWD